VCSELLNEVEHASASAAALAFNLELDLPDLEALPGETLLRSTAALWTAFDTAELCLFNLLGFCWALRLRFCFPFWGLWGLCLLFCCLGLLDCLFGWGLERGVEIGFGFLSLLPVWISTGGAREFPPPQAQHMTFDEKSSSSNCPQFSGVVT